MSEKQENIIVNKKSIKPFFIMIIVDRSLIFFSIILYIISSVFGFLVGFDAFNIVAKIIDVGS